MGHGIGSESKLAEGQSSDWKNNKTIQEYTFVFMFIRNQLARNHLLATKF